MSGEARLDNRKYKDRFGAKAKMLDAAEVLAATSHPVGGVCPIGLPRPLRVYADVSLRALRGRRAGRRRHAPCDADRARAAGAARGGRVGRRRAGAERRSRLVAGPKRELAGARPGDPAAAGGGAIGPAALAARPRIAAALRAGLAARRPRRRPGADGGAGAGRHRLRGRRGRAGDRRALRDRLRPAGLCDLRPEPGPRARSRFGPRRADPRRGAAALGRRPAARGRARGDDGAGVGHVLRPGRHRPASASSPSCCPSRSATAT